VIRKILTHLGLPARAATRPGAAAGVHRSDLILATTTALRPGRRPGSACGCAKHRICLDADRLGVDQGRKISSRARNFQRAPCD